MRGRRRQAWKAEERFQEPDIPDWDEIIRDPLEDLVDIYLDFTNDYRDYLAFIQDPSS